jgi:hypothetical protein
MMPALSGFALAVALLAAPALAQSAPDTSASAESSESEVELRKPRKWALSAEVGMNSLSSLVGPVATFYVKPQIAVDLGVGVSSVGIRPGLRARYAFSLEKTAYFAGIGFKHGLGSGGEEVEIEDPDTKEKLKVEMDASNFLDLMVGVEFMADNGFLVIATAGYSTLLGDKIYTVSEETPASDKAIKAFDTIFGSGIMLSVSLGKAF